MNVALSVKPASTEELIERARALVPSLRARAAKIAENRSIPEDVWKDLEDAGLLELMRPKRFGGQEYTAEEVTRVGRELGYGDGATAWVYMVTAAHDVFMPLFPEEIQAEYWNSERPVGASSYVPTGKAEIVEGGYRLNGKWSFCSGIDHSGWVLLGGIVGMLENGFPDYRYFLLPEKDFTIVDDWYVMGLCGTGSKSVQIDNAFVPNDYAFKDEKATAGVPSADHPDYQESVWPAISFSLAAPATGIASAAYEAVVKDLQARFARKDPIFSARLPMIRVALGEISAMIDASDLLFRRAMDESFAMMASHTRIPTDLRVRSRRDTSYSVKLALEAVQKLMGVAGASGTRDGHPVNRALRDLYAINSHPAVNMESPAGSFGSVALGGDPLEMKI